ncbi:hypothetical protein GDO78_008710 [Eleutherodactylus coqui]|uniref:Methyltransferase domain-containing protein n=1 Tax=Eleutherodactylus coqui TaxID=57060 RepID=A0A8J6FE93_ELECQ|nr:hypothetical protein GDO78_008710 [Eleutherodactylus coqui]KAG9485762.1 hypothetical protein GDO78_008710 [Eleutherodactylus coqui]KAG9485763.1 hypothetical protein GDO78_008710 [Eleutherodactylus coqui]
MADCGKRLQQVRDVITAAHKSCSVSEKLQFYDQWAAQYEEDVSVLEYEAPHLAALALASVCRLNRESKLVLDVACGTGRAAEEVCTCYLQCILQPPGCSSAAVTAVQFSPDSIIGGPVQH